MTCFESTGSFIANASQPELRYHPHVNDELAARLRRLDAEPDPAAIRFDNGPPIGATAAVLPSAFNPPTHAHQHLLERAVARFGIVSAIALLTTRNVDKGVNGASLSDRVGMLLALRAEMPALAVMASNQARIIDQAVALNSAFPATEFDFVVGFDTLERLFAPRYYEDMERELAPFFGRHRVLAANRAAVGARDVEAWLDANAGQFRDRIAVLEIDEVPASLSSTQIRQALQGNRQAFDVAPGVRRYIEEHALYR